MDHIRFKNNDDGKEVHFRKNLEFTLCGLAQEGENFGADQGFAVVAEPVDCPECIDIVRLCQGVQEKELIATGVKGP